MPSECGTLELLSGMCDTTLTLTDSIIDTGLNAVH